VSKLLRHKKQLGQHFLVNEGAVRTICGAALASKAPLIVEIGPGDGAITGPLLNDGRPLWVVELDIDACQLLSQRYGGVTNFNILRGDAVSVELPEAASVCVVGNLPYNAATAILTRFLIEPVPWERMVLMFQLEVGQKLKGCPGEKSYGPLSVLAQTTANLKTLIKLGPNSFDPPPKVDSIVLLFEPRHDSPDTAERKSMLSILHRSFAHRRKTIANNWSSFLSLQQIDSICGAAGISALLRAEAIPPAKWIEITRAVKLLKPPDCL
jgi:16S rRNA (adenine1518-N6/adenine1519-N6)-dimethyltransferase